MSFESPAAVMAYHKRKGLRTYLHQEGGLAWVIVYRLHDIAFYAETSAGRWIIEKTEPLNG